MLHIQITVIYVIESEIKKQVCLCSLAVCVYEISRRTGIFARICIRQLSTYNIRRISNLLKTFEVQMLSNLNSNLVTSLVFTDRDLICLRTQCIS